MAKKLKLDEKSAYGTIFGGGIRRFEQGGNYFNSNGDQVPDDEQIEGTVDSDEKARALALENAELKKQLEEAQTKNGGSGSAPTENKKPAGKANGHNDQKPEDAALNDQLAAQGML